MKGLGIRGLTSPGQKGGTTAYVEIQAVWRTFLLRVYLGFRVQGFGFGVYVAGWSAVRVFSMRLMARAWIPTESRSSLAPY